MTAFRTKICTWFIWIHGAVFHRWQLAKITKKKTVGIPPNISSAFWGWAWHRQWSIWPTCDLPTIDFSSKMSSLFCFQSSLDLKACEAALTKLIELRAFFYQNHESKVDSPATNAKCCNSSWCKVYNWIICSGFIWEELSQSCSNSPYQKLFPSTSCTINIES